MKSFLFLTSVIALAAAGILGAAEVGAIKFDQKGSSKLPENQLFFNIKLRKNMQFSQEIVDNDIKRLYETGNFADVVSEVETGKDGKINVTYKTTLKPRISKIIFVGNQKFKTSELSKDFSLKVNSIMNDFELRDDLNKVRKFYSTRGYTDATVLPVFTTTSDNKVQLTIKINEHLRLKVKDTSFKGNTVFPVDVLKKSIVTSYSFWNNFPFLNDFFNRGLLDRSELNLDKARLKEKYQDAGFLDFKIKDTKIIPDEKDPEFVIVSFDLEEGKPYKVGKVSLEGFANVKKATLLPFIKLKEGETFSLLKEQNTCKSIVQYYETLGYVDIICRAVRSEDPQTHTVDVKFIIGEGRKYHVRDVVIVGNTDTKDKVIRRELAIQPGDPVDRTRIEVTKKRLMGMGYFTKVTAEAVNADLPTEKDIKITVTEKDSRYNLRAGVGASDVSSAFGMAEISSNNFDISNPDNLFYGGGQRARMRGIFGLRHSGFNVDFVEPWLNDLPIKFELSGYMNVSEYDDWNETHTGLRTSITRKIFDDFTSIAVGYKFEVVKVNHVSHKLRDYFEANDYDGSFIVSQPSITLARDTRDSLIDPTEGYNLTLFTSVTPKILGSSDNYYRMELKGSYYANFWDKAIITMLGLKLGTVSGFNSNDMLPVFERYYMGGSGSVRGFEYRSIGEHLHGANIGGQTMLLLTSELTHPIYGIVRGAIFADAGTAWAKSYDIALSDINVGAGYGLRIKIPMLKAPIKLDLAYPIVNNQDEEKSKLRFHFNIGFTF